jgi:hypothetical protein
MCSAQITRSFWGLELGRSTKQNVIDVLKQKGYSPQIDNSDNTVYIITGIWNNFKYGGGFWTYASFEFHNGKLMKVHFQNNEEEIIMDIALMYEDISEKLETKYYRYKKQDIGQPPYYDDGKTLLSLAYGFHNGIRRISITYYDNTLWEQQHQDEYDEL